MKWLAALVIATRVAAADPAPQLDITGYVEAFYQYNFNQPSNFITAYRAFDDRTNSFTIENAVLDVKGTLGHAFTRVALQIGHTGSAYYGAEPVSVAQAGVGDSDANLWRFIQQAIVGYKANDLTLEGGIFLSTIGLEGLAIKDQWNWSRSDLFNALPFYHAGVRASYALSDKVSVVGMVTNGWNDVVNRNPYPCLEAALVFAPSKLLTGQVLYFGGVERPTDAPEGQPWRHLFDAVATLNVTDAVALAGQADAGFERNNFGTSYWYDGAIYARVHVHRHLYVAARGDFIIEHVPAMATAMFFPTDELQSLTLTADYHPIKNLAVKLEYRYDQANDPLFFAHDVAQDATGADIATDRTQQTLTLGATSWF